jgi:hypothetical protein
MKQVRAMACDQYEIGIRDVSRGVMMTRVWDAAEIERSIRWLKFINMKGRGNDIYIRPAGSVGLVLVDDLDADGLTRMKADGIPPAVIVETSSHNYQAWVRLSESPLSPNDATDAAKVLAQRYGGDPNSAAWRHYGRLAGFTNRKPDRQRPDGRHPFVLLLEATGATAVAALDGILSPAKYQQPSPAPPSHPGPVHPDCQDPLLPPGENYTRHAQWLLARYSDTDYSRLDWMVCRDIAASSPAIDRAYLEEALCQGSPELSERKVGHVDDYVRRTAEKVLRDPHVVARRAALGHLAVASNTGLRDL